MIRNFIIGFVAFVGLLLLYAEACRYDDAALEQVEQFHEKLPYHVHQ
jgi:hypothetical protein